MVVRDLVAASYSHGDSAIDKSFVEERNILNFFGSDEKLRATTSARVNFLSILQEKTYFFYFTHSLLQNTHISLSILHIHLIKYSFFLHFLLFHSLSSLAQIHHLVFSVHTHT